MLNLCGLNNMYIAENLPDIRQKKQNFAKNKKAN